MLNIRAAALAALAGILIALGATACAQGELGITNFDDLTLSGDLVVGDDATIGDDLAVTGDLTVTGSMPAGSGAYDLNGGDLTVDADGDTIIDETSDDNIRLTSGAAGGLWNILTGNLKVGNGTPGTALGGEDAYIEGSLEVDGGIIGAEDMPSFLMPVVATAAFTYTAGAGGVVPLFTIPADEVWVVWDVLVKVTDTWVAAGDDETVTIGTGDDVAGFCSLSDNDLATTEVAIDAATGYTCVDNQSTWIQATYSGWPVDGAETIDAEILATGNDLSAGAATAYLFYTRIE